MLDIYLKLCFNITMNPNLIIDIGANVGNYTSEILNLYPDIEIHLFEPSKKNFEI